MDRAHKSFRKTKFWTKNFIAKIRFTPKYVDLNNSPIKIQLTIYLSSILGRRPIIHQFISSSQTINYNYKRGKSSVWKHRIKKVHNKKRHPRTKIIYVFRLRPIYFPSFFPQKNSNTEVNYWSENYFTGILDID